MKKQITLLLVGLVMGFPLLAQHEHGNPFRELGYKGNVYTLTDYNEEFHDNDVVVEIGQVLYDTQKREIVGFVGEKDHRIELIKDVISTSIDPHCEKYPWISPYAYCFNNPINFIDPDGRDVWDINDKGKIVKRIKDDTQDAFFMVDSKGNRTYTTDADGNKNYNSISFEYGTITGSKKANFFRDATSFSLTNEAASGELFKFFADNTKIEYGLINTLNDGSTVMTNHKEGSVNANIVALEMDKRGQTVTSIVHNHPNSTGPSGFRPGATSGDKFAANTLRTSHGRAVENYVYQPARNTLVSFDGKGINGGPMPWGLTFSPSGLIKLPVRPFLSYPGKGLPPP